MVNFLPAVLLGGPPHAGKSVLFYRLTQVLRERGIEHYALRACADGEGNWFHEGEPALVSNLRVKLTSEWPPAFVQSIGQALEHRSLPFLVDMGGRLRPSQECLLQGCTHAVLLLREDRPEESQHWHDLIEGYNLLPLARVFSQLAGESTITTSSPVLEGVITRLERSTARAGAGDGPFFDALFERIAMLFTSYASQEQRERHLQQASTELVLDVQQELRHFTTDSTLWEPGMLPKLLARLPQHIPLSVYGAGPGWLYAALAAYEDPLPFYLFDPKVPFGWIQPALVALQTRILPVEDITVQMIDAREATILKISFPYDRLEYLRPDPLLFPPAKASSGLIIDGRVPYWLLTALVRLYKAAGVPWIATFYPPLGQAVVVYADGGSPQPGHLVARPDR